MSTKQNTRKIGEILRNKGEGPIDKDSRGKIHEEKCKRRLMMDVLSPSMLHDLQVMFFHPIETRGANLTVHLHARLQ